MSTSYHPWTDGQIEVINKCLEGYLRNFVNERKTQCLQWIHLAEWWYNSTYHTSTKMSPFETLYGYPPPTSREYVINNFKVPVARDYLATSDEFICILKNHLEQERNHMKQQEDLERTDR